MAAETSWITFANVVAAIAAGISWFALRTSMHARRDVHQIKRLDLRLRLRESVADYRAIVDELEPLLNRALQSHQRALTPLQGARSGAMVLFEQEHARDVAIVYELQQGLPNPGATFHDLDPEELESKIVALRTRRVTADGLKTKYEASLAGDDRLRQQIADANSRSMATILGQAPR